MTVHSITDAGAGAGEMAERIRAFDWDSTPLGPASTWSPALTTTLRIILASRFPHVLWWGPEYIQFYNDAYRPIPGTKHPDRALGVPARECWPEIWHILQPLIDRPFHGGPATWNDDITLEIDRHGFLEETHFTIAYSPAPDDAVPSGIGGVLATVHEITEKVVGQRRIAVLRDLGARIQDPRSGEDACAMAAEALRDAHWDLPFALLYLLDADARHVRLAGVACVSEGEPVSPLAVDLDGTHPWAHAMTTAFHRGSIVTVRDLGTRFPAIPAGPWSDPPSMAALVPIPASRAGEFAGILVAGISARRGFDDSYRDFLELVKTQIGTAITTARAYEHEKKRAEELAELDRAKTTFFSNVSHEFRTPLTLILGPLEDALESASPAERDPLERVHRNALRLQKLVNTLLDFSRIEAGRIQASFEPLDLAALTRDVASAFRAGMERAGLTLTVDCPPLPEPVYVDRDLWEKIVLNLLSNAFKFTLEGGIEVRLRHEDGKARLSIHDTGAGIPPEELSRVFERFHRIEGVKARTHEGTGIGLALANELVKVHGGTISVESVVGRGSTFTISIPVGRAHLPEDRIAAGRTLASTALQSQHYLAEALRWLPAEASPPVAVADAAADVASAGLRRRVLWADDNADMREYVRQLLAPHYDVECVEDGEAALESARREPPDLILADIMMPRLDGLALLRAIRGSERTRSIPVILLSARAGEEASIEGLEAGADQYLVKPFSARELLARVHSQLELSHLRRESAEAQRESERKKDVFLAVLAHELRNPLAPIRNAASYLRKIRSNAPELDRPLQMIERQVGIMARLVDDLMDVSRISRETLTLRMGRVDLAEVAEAAVDGCREVVNARGHLLTVILPERPMAMRGDRDRLVQVLGNLISNAAKYTPEGGRIEVELVPGQSVIDVTVRDNGRGIPEEKLREIFELFAQVDRTFDGEAGLGIGLTLAKQLVELHGGTIEARSAGAGLGSEFRVVLPRGIVEAAPAPHGTLESALPRTILVADDNVDSAESLALLLEAHGHRVHVAYDGESALAVAERVRPGVAFIDIGMPKRSGYEVAREIRDQSWGEGMHLVAVTGWGQESDRKKALEVGFDAHLVKPATPDVLLTMLAAFDAPPPTRVRVVDPLPIHAALVDPLAPEGEDLSAGPGALSTETAPPAEAAPPA